MSEKRAEERAADRREDRREDRAKFTVIATLVAFVILFPLAVGFAQWYTANQNRISDNEAAISREAAARKAALSRERELRNRSDWVAFDACIAGEARDAALVTALTKLVPASKRPQAIIDLIDALEPPHDDDRCVIPGGPRPDDLPPAVLTP